MSRRLLVGLATVGLALALAASTAVASPPQMFVTPLSGAEEVPARPTLARGVAIFQLRGEVMTYRLIASNIDNVIAAHIHIGTPEENGPVAVFLFGAVAPGGGSQDGVLETGTITAANFIGPLAGQGMSALVDAITSGNAYVNVHTSDGVGDPNSGAGDFPGGEIRGHLD